MKSVFALCTAAFFSLSASSLVALDDAYSGFHMDVPEGFVEDFGWRDVDMWGSEYVFATEEGRVITLEVSPFKFDEESVQFPSEFTIHMEIKTSPFRKGRFEGNIVEVVANDRTVSCVYQLHDENYTYEINFTNLEFREEDPFSFFSEADEDNRFKEQIDLVIDSIYNQNEGN